MKKVLSIILSLVMVLSMIGGTAPFFSVAYADDAVVQEEPAAEVPEGSGGTEAEPPQGGEGPSEDGGEEGPTRAGNVAKIGETEYATLQDAVDAAYGTTGDVTISLISDVTGYVIVKQIEGLNLTIDGANHKIAGQIVINGNGRSTGTETLTIKNINFEDDKSNFCKGKGGAVTDSFILVPSLKDSGADYYTNQNNYAHNITVSDCTFTSTSSLLDVVAFKTSSGGGNGYNIVLSNLTGTNLHSLAQLTSTQGVTVTGCTLTACESGVNISTGAGDYVFSNNSFSCGDGYGIRLQANSSTNIVLDDTNTISANTALQLGKDNSSSGGFVITGGSYTGSIVKKNTGTGTFQISGGTFSPAAPDSSYLPEGYEAHDNGDGTFTVQEKGLKIDSVSPTQAYYDGTDQKGSIRITVIDERDGSTVDASNYTVSWKDADGNPVTELKNVGRYTVVVTGTGAYEGKTAEKAGAFAIGRASIANYDVVIDPQTYTGFPITPAITFKDGFGTDLNGVTYDITSITNNTNVGQASVNLTGTGNYIGSANGSFDIVPADIANTTITLDKTSFFADESVLVPSVVVALGEYTLKSSDYTISYAKDGTAVASPSDPGTYSVVVTAAGGNFTGSKTAEFEIKACTIELSETAVSGTAGNSASIAVTKINGADPADKLAQVTWETSDANVAKYEDGKIVFVGGGTATITAKYGAYAEAEVAVTVVDAVARIGENYYAAIADAVAAAQTGDTVEILKAGTYTLPSLSKNITIKGNVDDVVFNHTGSGNVASVPNGATFENVTFNFGTNNYHGFQSAGTIKMNGCTINGKFFSYADMEFTDCTFNAPGSEASGISSKDYSMWAYAGNLTYTDCTFNGAGKFLNVYNESGATRYTITATGCTFNSTESNKAAFNVKETSTSNVLQYTVNLNNNMINENFPTEGETTNPDGTICTVISGLVQVDDRVKGGTDDGGEIVVNVDNEQVYITPRITRVAKIGDVEYKTLAEAIAAVPADGTETTITMIADESILGNAGVTVPATKNIVLDLNGKTITGFINENKSAQVITNKGTLTITDTSSEQNGKITNNVAEGVDVGSWPTFNYATNIVTNSGNLTVNAGTLENNAAGSICYAVDNNSTTGNAILTVNGGTLKAKSSAVRLFCNSTTNENTLNITGGTITTSGSAGFWVQLPGSGGQAKKATLNISGGTISGNSYAFYDYSFGDVYDAVNYNITGGTFIGNVFSYGANINIEGGTFTGEVAINQENPSEVSVSGGTFSDDCYTYGANASEGFITGGTFKSLTYEYEGETYDCDWMSLLHEDYTYEQIASGDYVVVPKKVAQIGDVTYPSLQKALDAAHEMTGDVTVELIVDITENATIHQKDGLNITLDGNEKTITGRIYIDGNGRYDGTDTLTIQNAKFAFDGASDDTFIHVNAPSSGYNYAHNITVKNCEFAGEGTTTVAFRVASGAGANKVILENNTVTNGHSFAQLVGVKDLTITGNTITGTKNGINISGGNGTGTISGNTLTSDGYTVRIKDGSGMVVTLSDNTFDGVEGLVSAATGGGKLIIESGKYAGPLPTEEGKLLVNGGLFTVAPADEVCADGKVAVASGDADYPYTVGVAVAKIGDVKYTSVSAAAAAAKSGETVELLTSVTEDVVIPAESNMVLKCGSGKVITGSITNYGTFSTSGTGKVNGPITNYGTATLNSSFTAGDVVGKDGTLSVKGGSYSSLTADGGSVTATGGMYTTAPEDSCVAVGYVVALGTNATYPYQVMAATSVEARIGEAYYRYLATACAEAQDGDTVVLVKSTVSISASNTPLQLNTGKKYTIDLNGNKISGSGGNATYDTAAILLRNGTDVTFVDSSSDSTGVITSAIRGNTGSVFSVGDTSILTIGDGVDVTSALIWPVFVKEQGTVNVYGNVSSTTTTAQVICGNGTDNTQNTTINIYEGAVVTGGCDIDHDASTGDGGSGAIYQPQAGTINIYGGTVDNIDIRSGNLNITGGSVASVHIQKNGPTLGYAGNVTINVSDENAVVGPITVFQEAKAAITISDGKIDSVTIEDGALEDASAILSGGLYKIKPNEEYVITGKNVVPSGIAEYPYTIGEAVASITRDGNTVYYLTLEAAVAAAQDGDTIELLKSTSGNGIVFPQDKFNTSGITVDFKGFTYTVDGSTVGSTGTETNGFQLLMNNTITFKNGTINSEKAKILIQNYSDLTLDGMTLTLNNADYAYAYTLSNNNGDVVIKDTTINANPAGGVAFDVCRYDVYPSVNVTVQGESVINGDIEVYASNGDAKDGLGLTISAGTINGSIVLDETVTPLINAGSDKANIIKNNDVVLDAPAPYAWMDLGNGTSKLAAAVAKIGDVYYATLDAALDAAVDGNTVELLKDLSVDRVIYDGSADITLDLGTHTITGRVSFFGGKVTVDNGTIDGRFDIYDSAVVTLAADAQISGYAVVWGDGTYGEAECKTPTFNVYGTITNIGTTVFTNGSDLSGAIINIYDGAVITSAEEVGIYLPSGNLTVNGGTITGGTGIFMRGGTLNVPADSTAVITGNGEDADPAFADTGDGANTTGEAVTIVASDYPAGLSSETVKIAGGTFISEKADAVGSYAIEGQTAIDKFITGGVFSSDPKQEYLADGYYSYARADGKYEVGKLTVEVDETANTAVARIGTQVVANIAAEEGVKLSGIDLLTVLKDMIAADKFAPNAASPADMTVSVDLVKVSGTIEKVVYTAKLIITSGNVTHDIANNKLIAGAKFDLTLNITELGTAAGQTVNVLHESDDYPDETFTAVSAVSGSAVTADVTVAHFSTLTVTVDPTDAVASITKDGTTTYYASLRSAVAAAEAGDTIEMLKDDPYTFAEGGLVIDKNLTINGNGKTVTGLTEYGVENVGSADAITDSNVHGFYIKSGNVTINELKMTQFGDTDYVNKFGMVPILTAADYSGTLTLNNVDIDKFNRQAICIFGGTFAITGGTIDGNAANKGDGFDHFQQGIEIRGGSGTIDGVKVTGMASNVGFPGIGIVSWSSGDVTINNVDVNVNGIGIEADYNTVTVSGANTKVEATDKALFVEDGGKLIISDGTYTGSVAVDSVEGSTIEISDGRYSEYVIPDYVVEGKLCTTVKQADGYYHIVPAITVTFDADNKADDTDVTTVLVPKGEAVAAPEAPTNGDFVFGGWFLENAAAAYDFTTAVTEDITLTAQWKTKVVYNVDGVQTEMDAILHQATPTIPDPVKDNYIFNGWLSSATNEVTMTVPETVEAANIIYTATWKGVVKQVIYTDGLGNVLQSSEVEYGQPTPAFEGSLEGITKEGYEFDASNPWTPAVKETVDGDIVYVLNWTKIKLTVTFVTDGSEVPAQTVDYGDKAAEPTTVRDGYTFTGWYDEDDQLFDFENTVIKKDITLTAKWFENVARIGNKNYPTLAEAVAAAQNGETVELLKDFSGAGIFLGTADAKNITIDLGGHTFTMSGPAVGSSGTATQALHLEKGNAVVLKNGTITTTAESNAFMVIQNYGDLTLEDVTLDGSNMPGTDNYTLSNNCGNVVIGDGTHIIANDGSYAFDVCVTIYYPDGVTVTVKEGAVIDGDVQYDVWGGIPADNKAVLTIEGGIFNGTFDIEDALAEAAKTNIIITGGAFADDTGNACKVPEGQKLFKDADDYYRLHEFFTVTFVTEDGIEAPAAQEVISGEKAVEPAAPAKEGYSFLGWFETDAEEAFDFETAIAADKTLTARWAQNVARIGDTYYLSLAAAVEAAQAGDTVVLLVDTVEGGITVDKKITLDLNGNEVSYNNSELFVVNAAGDLTITGNGKITGPANGEAFDSHSLIRVDGGKLTIENGTLTASGAGSDGMYGVYVLGNGTAVFGTEDGNGPTINSHFAAIGTNNTTAPATITVYGGTYTANAAPADGDWWSYFCAPIYAAAAGNFDIKGGTFNGYYGISSRYNNVDQDIMIGAEVTISASSGTQVFVDEKQGVVAAEDRHVRADGNERTIPEGYIWIPTETEGVYEIAIPVTVTFVTEDGITAPDAQIIGKGTKATRPDDPVKDHFNFAGWFLGDAEDPFDFNTPVTEDITLTAKWNAVIYTITYKDGTEENGVLQTWTATYGDPTPVFRFEDLTVGQMNALDEYGASSGKNYDPDDLWIEEVSATVTGDAVYTLKWVAEYTVSFNADGGTPVPEDQKVLSGKTAVKPADPAKTDYQFLGWFAEGAAEAFDFETPITADTKLTAKWSAYVAKIGDTYYESLAAAVAAAQAGDTVVLLVDTVEGGITVDKKITLDLNGNEVSYNNSELFVVAASGDLTITGNGKITGPANGEAFDSQSLIRVDGGKLTIENGTLTAAGAGSDGMYGVYVRNGGTAVFGTEDGNGPTITSHFAAIGTNNTTAPATITVYGGTYTANAAPADGDWWSYFCAPIYAAAAGNFDIKGGTFNGYYGISDRYVNVDQDIMVGDGVVINATSGTDIFVDEKTGAAGTEDRHIRADGNERTIPEGYVWIPTETEGVYEVAKAVTVSFDAAGGTPEPNEQVIGQGTTAEMPADPVKEGFRFLGWFAEGAEEAFDFETPITADTTLTAKWIKQYTVSYSDGTEEDGNIIQSYTVDEGTATPEFDMNALTYLQYVIIEQYGDENNVAIDQTDMWTPEVAATVTEDVTYKLNWKQLYKITFKDELNDWTFERWTDVSGAISEIDTIPVDDPQNDSYTFLGWFNGETRLDPNTATFAADTVLTAKWSAITFTVTFDVDGDTTAIVAQEVIKGEQAVKPADPVKEGRIFLGWTLNGEEYDFTVPVTEDIELKATWKDYKFRGQISSKDSSNSIGAVTGTVYEDYTASLVISGDNVNSGNAAVDVWMQNVGSLGITDERHHRMTLDFGAGNDVSLADLVIPMFNGLPGTSIVAMSNGKSVIYSIAADGADGRAYTATPNSYDKASAVWHEIVRPEHISVTTGIDDSYLIIMPNSSIQAGTTTLEFEEAKPLVIDNITGPDALNSMIRDAIKVGTAEESVDGVVIRLAAGTKLAVGESIATLNECVTITITGDGIDSAKVVEAINALQTSEESMIRQILSVVKAAIEMVEGKTTIVEFEFGHDIKHVDVVDPTCEEAGTGEYYICQICGKMFGDEAGTEDIQAPAEIPALGHDWGEPTYEWAEDNSTVTATRVCGRDASHVESETVNTVHERIAPECDTWGEDRYTATFTNTAFEQQKKTVYAGEPLGHDWQLPPTWDWAEDYSTATANFICQRHGEHDQHLAAVIDVKTTAPTRFAEGTTTYTAEVTGPDGVVYKDVKTVSIPVIDDYKFKGRISSENAGLTGSVTGRVYEDYVASLVIEGDYVNSGNASVEVWMRNIASLGITDERYHGMDLTLAAGGSGSQVPLSKVIELFSKLNGSVVIGKIGANTVTYLVEQQDEDGRIFTATPNSYDKAGAVWHAIVNTDNIIYGTGENDSKIVLKNGSSIQVGSKTLEFESADDLVINNIADLDAVGAAVRAALKVGTADESFDGIVIRLAAGTKLAVGSSYAELKQCVKITITGDTLQAEYLEPMLAELQGTELGGSGMISKLFGLVSAAVEMVSGQTTIVEFEFGHDPKLVEAVAATCEEPGTEAYYICQNCGMLFSDEDCTAEIEAPVVAPALGHDWGEPTYEWAEDNSKVTATKVCGRDANHVETETVDTTKVETAATCEDAGYTTFTAIFTKEGFTTQTKVVEGDAALSHDWDETVFTWAEDGKTATATRTCKRDASHIEEVVCIMSSVVKTPATCEAAGTTTYTATAVFADATVEQETKDVADIPALGHDWEAATFTWAADGKTATAARVCHRDATHTETANVVMTSEVTTQPTCTEKGVTTYTATATFADGTTATDTNAVEDIAALGHDMVHYNGIEPTCTEGGYTDYYKCSRCGLVEDYEDLLALGHLWGEAAFTWAADGKTATASRVCERDETHVQNAEMIMSSAVKTPATCEAVGTTTYTATAVFPDGTIAKDTNDVNDIPATGHRWSEPEYTWAEDNSTVTAKRFCFNDETHIETETASTTSVTTAPTCVVDGKTVYTATFENEVFTTQTKTVEIRCVGHHEPGEVVYENQVAPTFSSIGTYDEVVYCTECNEELSRTPQTCIRLKAANLILEGKITLNLKLEGPIGAGYTAKLYYEKNEYGLVREIALDNAHYVTDETGSYLVASYDEIPAKELMMNIRIKVFDPEGNQIKLKTSKAYLDQYDYSVASWCTNKINANNDANDVMIAKALLNYGHYAQIALNYNADAGNEKLAKAWLESETLAFTTGDPAYNGVTAGGSALGGKAFNLDLESDTRIRLKLRRIVGVVIDGEDYRPEPEVDPTDGSSIWSVYKNNVPAKNMHQLHSFELTEGSNTVTMKYGVLSWANSKLGGSDVNDRNLAAAMYLYNYAARKYFEYDHEGLQ